MDGRDPATGQFVPGNAARLVHGRRSLRAQLALLPGQEELREMLADRRQRLIDDKGGISEVGLVLEDTIDQYQSLLVLVKTAEARIQKDGMFTAKGRTRASVSLHLSIVDRLLKLGVQLGLPKHLMRQHSGPELVRLLQLEEHASMVWFTFNEAWDLPIRQSCASRRSINNVLNVSNFCIGAGGVRKNAIFSSMFIAEL